MRKLLIAAGVLPLLACSSEELERMQTEAKPITELSHVVAARMHRGEVLLSVRRELRNDSATYQSPTHTLELPNTAIVTSLKAGSEAVFLGVEEASARWSELTSPGDAEPTTSALLAMNGGGELELQLFGWAPGETVSIEYDVQLPPTYDTGGWAFDYPYGDATDWDPTVPAFDLTRTPGAALEVNDAYVHVTLPRAPIDRTDARWAIYRLGTDRTMWRLELDAAQILEPAPVRPNVVFVIDASHSEGPDGIDAQLELLAPYLANAPDAQVEVILYRRFAERLFGRFIPAPDVPRMLAAIPKEKLAPANGSNLERGAQLAAEALSQVAGIGRIVLMTDGATRDHFSNDATIAALAKAPRDTIVHVVLRQSGGTDALDERREDDHPLAPIAAASGGVLFRIGGHPEIPNEAATTMLGLVRPIRIDDFKVEALGLNEDQLDAPGTLLEGESLRSTALAPNPPAQITVTGRIWGRDYRKVVSVDPDLSAWMPGLALGERNIESQLTDDEVRNAALSSRAVSRVTSYLSTTPLAGASKIGTLVHGIYGSGFGTSCGCGGSFSSGCGGFHLGGLEPDYDGLLRRLLAPGIAVCARAHAVEAVIGSVTLEATGDEIVDVEAAAASAGLADCIREAAWAVRLSGEFSSRRTYQVELNP